MAETLNLAYICWIAGGVLLLISLYCAVHIVDVYRVERPLRRISSTVISEEGQAQEKCCSSILASTFYAVRVTRKRKILIAVYLVGMAQRVLDVAFASTVSVWISKHVYHGDLSKISYHNKLVIGISQGAAVFLGFPFGLAFDKLG